MGFSLTGTHVIFFVAAVIVAGSVSGIFIAVTLDISQSMSNTGERIQEQFDIDYKLINDPSNIPVSGENYIFYIKNIGEQKILTSNETFQLFLDGEIIHSENYSFLDDYIYPNEYTEMRVSTNDVTSGYHVLRLIGPLYEEDEFLFEI